MSSVVLFLAAEMSDFDLTPRLISDYVTMFLTVFIQSACVAGK
jgi:hypothetical protein